MKTIYRTKGSDIYFVVTRVPQALEQALRQLQFEAIEEGFARHFPANTPNLELIYKNFDESAEEMILQKAGLRPVPWQDVLFAFLELVRNEKLNWWLRGSAALAVRGLDIIPGDIDLTLDDAGAIRLGTLLLDHLVEPVVPVRNWFCNWWGRAFWHARIEWMGGVNGTADQPEVGDFGPVAEHRAETVHWRGHAILVPPLDLQLAVSERRGLAARAELIQRAMHGTYSA